MLSRFDTSISLLTELGLKELEVHLDSQSLGFVCPNHVSEQQYIEKNNIYKYLIKYFDCRSVIPVRHDSLEFENSQSRMKRTNVCNTISENIGLLYFSLSVRMN
jgi:hypothetical protein